MPRSGCLKTRMPVPILSIALVLIALIPGSLRAGSILEGPVTIETGILFLYGHRIEPPYVFEVAGGDTLLVNGIPICPTYRTDPEPVFEVSELARRQHEVTEEVCWAGDRLRAGGTEEGAILDSMASLFGSYPSLFDSVKVQGRKLLVYDRGDPNPEHMGVPNYSRRGLVSEGPPKGPESWFSSIGLTLEGGQLLIIEACGCDISIQRLRVPAALAEIERVRSLKTEDLAGMTFRFINQTSARQFISPLPLPSDRRSR